MSTNSSFLPDDYLDQRADRRTNIISVVLFVVVMLGVFLAYLATNQKQTRVEHEQFVIGKKYEQAATQIRDLMLLEEQKKQMLDRADVAAALVERVPRSVLLAEMINRMPPQLSLISFELDSDRLRPVAKGSSKGKSKKKGRGKRMAPKRAAVQGSDNAEAPKLKPPKYDVDIELTGVAPSMNEVTMFMAELNDFPILRDVTLQYSEQKEFDGVMMQQFSITTRLDPNADVRDVEPRIAPRAANATMSDQLRLIPNQPVGTAAAPKTVSAEDTDGGEEH